MPEQTHVPLRHVSDIKTPSSMELIAFSTSITSTADNIPNVLDSDKVIFPKDWMTPETWFKMSKKIAQLTKIVYALHQVSLNGVDTDRNWQLRYKQLDQRVCNNIHHI
jgi:hypothetical protein